MLCIVNDIDHPYLELIKDDPIRQNIPADFRIQNNREVIVLVEDSNPSAVVCVSYNSEIPVSEDELANTGFNPTIAVFYAIWSYKNMAGIRLLKAALKHLQENRKEINRYVTLSPNMDIARRFHTINGAKLLKENKTSINYEYVVSDLKKTQK